MPYAPQGVKGLDDDDDDDMQLRYSAGNLFAKLYGSK
jgi:hypothetical protein